MKVRQSRWIAPLLAGSAGLASVCSMVGCQVVEGGQLLPSPYYAQDDVQYFPPDNEFKLSREAAAMQQFKAERELAQP
ncbi:MAG TPA: hypothetical protein VGN57_01385 [Pirellulaceae bacterium]|nr:hypothetical protein [Pirellulaceae bacterium]